MTQDESNETYNYDRIIKKYSEFFRNPKYNIYDLEKFIFLIEMKLELNKELKIKIFNPTETVMNVVMIFIIAATVLVLLSQAAILSIIVLAVFTYISLFFTIHILKAKTANQVSEYMITKRKYVIIKKCIEKEIVRRKENNVRNS